MAAAEKMASAAQMMIEGEQLKQAHRLAEDEDGREEDQATARSIAGGPPSNSGCADRGGEQDQRAAAVMAPQPISVA